MYGEGYSLLWLGNVGKVTKETKKARRVEVGRACESKEESETVYSRTKGMQSSYPCLDSLHLDVNVQG